MKIKKVLKIIGIIIAVLIILVLIHTIRNYIIVTDLQSKISNYQDSKNYHIKSVANSNDGTTNTKIDYYRKDNKQAIFIERNTNGEIVKLSIYDNGERVDTFTETQESKTAKLNSGEMMPINIYNYLETDNKWQTFLGCINARIKTTNLNGKEYYIAKEFLSSTSLTSEGEEIYIDKETGLFFKSIESDIISERYYEFDKVEDSIFTEPDISEYTLNEID